MTIWRESSSYDTQLGVPRDWLYESTYCARRIRKSSGFDPLHGGRIAELVVVRVDR